MASAALRHPIRVRLLEAMNLGSEISATMFVNEGLGEDLEAFKGRTPQQMISDVSYHLKELEKANCVTFTRKVRRRGAKEYFYRANAVAYFSDEQWAAMALDERREISRVVAQGFIVQIEGAILAGTFDSRPNRWLLYEPLELDERGWHEITSVIAVAAAEVARIGREAAERVGDDGTPIHATFGVAAFESPGFTKAAPAGDGILAPDDQG